MIARAEKDLKDVRILRRVDGEFFAHLAEVVLIEWQREKVESLVHSC